MSSIIINISDDAATVETDTLAVGLDGEPLMFTTKAFPLPHLRMIVAGTGVAGLSSAWYRAINERMVVRDVQELNEYTPQALQNLFAGDFGDYQVANVSTTIYHVGVDVCGVFHGYSYSSAHGFASRHLPLDIQLMKPSAGPEPDPENRRNGLQLMNDQRRLQAADPADGKIYIGGEAMLLMLQSNGSILGLNQGRIDGYESDAAAIRENFLNRQMARDYLCCEQRSIAMAYLAC